MSESGTLYVVATPLGHLGDLSPRATAETLRTRRHRGGRGHPPHPAPARRPSTRIRGSSPITPTPRRAGVDELVALLAGGADVALVTDAGTPGDQRSRGRAGPCRPRRRGRRSSRCRDHRRWPPRSRPPACRVTVTSSSAFCPARDHRAVCFLERAASEPWSIVFFEAPGRLAELLDDLVAHGAAGIAGRGGAGDDQAA